MDAREALLADYDVVYPLGDYEAVYPAPVCQEKYPAPGYARSDALPGEPTLGVDVLRFDSGWQ